MRSKGALSTTVELQVPFFDIDMMQIVWHGHYVKYIEQARCALLDLIDYGYPRMLESGYGWPVIDLQLRYVQGATFGQRIRVRADLVEWRDRLKIHYLITDAEAGTRLTRASSVQVAVDITNRQMQFASPAVLLQRVERALARQSAPDAL